MGTASVAFQNALQQHHETRMQESRQLLDMAHEQFFPIVQKYHQGDPSITEPDYQFAMGQLSNAMREALGKRGKTAADLLDHTARKEHDLRVNSRPSGPPEPNGSVPGMDSGPGSDAGGTGALNFRPPQGQGSPGSYLPPGESSAGSLAPTPQLSPPPPTTLAPFPPPQPANYSVPEQGFPQAPQGPPQSIRSNYVDTQRILGQGAGAATEAQLPSLAAATRQQTSLAREAAAQDFAIKKARFDEFALTPAYKALSPRQQVQVASEMLYGLKTALAPERPAQSIPGLRQGSSIAPGTLDDQGNPISPESFYRERRLPDGTSEFIQQLGVTSAKLKPDTNSRTGWSEVWYDRAGNEVNRVKDFAPQGAYAPQTSTTTGVTTQIKEIGGQMIPVQIPSSKTTVRQRAIPGGGTLPSAPGETTPSGMPPPPSSTPRPSAGALRTGPSLGAAPVEQHRSEENPLTASALSVVLATKPTISLIDQTMREMKKLGMDKSSTPGTSFLPRLAYALGFGGKESEFLGKLSLDQIISAGSALKSSGGVRAVSALNKAMVHTPEAWKDSGSLMYSKLKAIKDRLDEVVKVAREEGQRYPGLQRGMPPPPSGSGAHPDPLGVR